MWSYGLIFFIRPIAILNIFTWIIKPTSNYNSWLTGVTSTLFTEWPIPILSYTNRWSMVYSSWITLNMTAFASIKQKNNKTNQQHSRHSITADPAPIPFSLCCCNQPDTIYEKILLSEASHNAWHRPRFDKIWWFNISMGQWINTSKSKLTCFLGAIPPKPHPLTKLYGSSSFNISRAISTATWRVFTSKHWENGDVCQPQGL